MVVCRTGLFRDERNLGSSAQSFESRTTRPGARHLPVHPVEPHSTDPESSTGLVRTLVTPSSDSGDANPGYPPDSGDTY